MTGLETTLVQRLAPAFAAVAGAPADPAVRRSQRTDFQADGALPLARRLGRNPRDIASEIVSRSDLADLCDAVEVAGPGFINLTLADDALSRMVSLMAADTRLGVEPAAAPETVVVDYSAPNVAKEMHIGHVRSTVIGDAVARLLERLGHTVVRANHLGDWGTPFGMLIEHLVDLGEADDAAERELADLNAFYQAARRAFDSDEAFRERARNRVVALQAGDERTRELWRRLVTASQRYFTQVYEQLDVTLTERDFYGESFYNDRLDSVVDELSEQGLLRESNGATCAFPPGFVNREGEPLPLIVRKSDGGYGYPATDLAAIRYRTRDVAATRMLYVVGLPQRQHFEMVFAVAAQAGWLAPPARAEHVGFGSILGPDGKMFRTRAGGSVKLMDLIDEAVSRADEAVRQRNPELDAATRAEVARAVGIGAIKYADLSTDRLKDYTFDWDRMLSFDGNTAPYLQYAHARIRSIFRRAGDGGAGDRIILTHPAERQLVIELLSFPVIIGEVAESLEFHRLAAHLYAVATSFSSFYEKCPVLRADGDVRASRLALADLTARVLAEGLGVLGIRAPERM